MIFGSGGALYVGVLAALNTGGIVYRVNPDGAREVRDYATDVETGRVYTTREAARTR